MGCGQVKVKEAIVSGQVGFTYSVSVRNNELKAMANFSYNSKQERLSLPVLMNYLCFNLDQANALDGNFISVYDKEKDKFTYWVQRLDGVAIADEKNPNIGKSWVVYINESKKMTWDQVIETDLIVYPNDKIVWAFQEVGENFAKNNFQF